MLSRIIFGWAENRRRTALLRQFPDALAMIVRSVRVGIPVMEAMRTVAREAPEPTGPEFARLVDQVSIGVTVDEAVMEMAERCGHPGIPVLCHRDLACRTQTGGTLSETLENLADVIRKRVALEAKGKALASEARTSAMVLAALPIVTGGGLWALIPDYVGDAVQRSHRPHPVRRRGGVAVHSESSPSARSSARACHEEELVVTPVDRP